MADDRMPVASIPRGRLFYLADRTDFARTARVKTAAARRVRRTWHCPTQANRYRLRVGIDVRDSGDQRFGIGMEGRAEDRVCFPDFGDAPQINNGYRVRKIAHGIQIVRDK